MSESPTNKISTYNLFYETGVKLYKFSGFHCTSYSNSLWGYTEYSNKSNPAFENIVLPQYPGWQFVEGCWKWLEEEMCYYIKRLQWLWPIEAIKLWLASWFLQNHGTNYLPILYYFHMILLSDTNNFISDFKTIKFEPNILCLFLQAVLFF
jgi:hypothetical protein